METIAEALVRTIQTEAVGAALRNTLYSGADSVFYAPDLDSTTVESLRTARAQAVQSDPTVDKTLCVSVQDGGGGDLLDFTQQEQVLVRVIDCGRGDRLIQATRQALILLIDDHRTAVLSDSGIIEVASLERSGMLYDSKLKADFEVFTITYIRGGLL